MQAFISQREQVFQKLVVFNATSVKVADSRGSQVSINAYRRVRIAGIAPHPRGCGVRVEFQQPPEIAREVRNARRVDQWSKGKELQVGSLVCIVLGMEVAGKSLPRLFFATVSQRDDQALAGHHSKEGQLAAL